MPDTADHYIYAFVLATCDQYGFSTKPDKLGYGTVTVDGETMGVVRFIDQGYPPKKDPTVNKAERMSLASMAASLASSPPSSTSGASHPERPVKHSAANQQLQNLLASLETELRSSRRLSVRRLRLKRELGGDVIAWSGGPGTGPAEQFLAPRLAAIGIRLSGSATHTQDDDGSELSFWRFGNIPAALTDSRQEAEVQRLLALSGQTAKEAAEKLAQEERFDLLASWMRASRYIAIPFKVLRESQNSKAAEPLIALLSDPDSEMRGRAAATLGPLGGEQAARALCSILPNAEGDELLQIGWALDRLAWKGVVDPLMTALERTTEGYAMTALVGALRKCGAGDRGFKVLIKGLSKGDELAWECLAALYELKDPCAVAEVKVLLQRTSDQKLIRIAKMYLQAHNAI